jgi:class 3 adenylate cyclase
VAHGIFHNNSLASPATVGPGEDHGRRGTERRLAAIVAFDVAGYSRLKAVDDLGTLATLKDHREAATLIAQGALGRIRNVGAAGDGLLQEFLD